MLAPNCRLCCAGCTTTVRTVSRSRSAFIEHIQDGVHRDPGVNAQGSRARRSCVGGGTPTFGKLDATKAPTPRPQHNHSPN